MSRLPPEAAKLGEHFVHCGTETEEAAMFADHVAEHTLNDLQRYGPPKVVGGHGLDPLARVRNTSDRSADRTSGRP
jgi:hypothetical protein